MMNVLERWKAIWQSSKIGHLQKMMEIQEVAIADLQLQLKQERAERDEEIKQLLQQKMRSNEMLMAEIDKKNRDFRELAAGLEQVGKLMERLVAK
jgi:hypothetical protein